MNLNRRNLFEEMSKIGMLEDNEYTTEDFQSTCEDLANLIQFVDTLLSNNDHETIKN